MTTGFTRFAAIAVATVGILTAQSAAAGVLFNSKALPAQLWGGSNAWLEAGDPDTVGEDARLVAGTTIQVNGTYNIGGIDALAGSTLNLIQSNSTNGVLRLNGIVGSVGAGTAAFDSSYIDILNANGTGSLVNTGSSTLAIGRFNTTGNGSIRNQTGNAGRMDLIGLVGRLADNAHFENEATFDMHNTVLLLRDSATFDNESNGTFIQSGGLVSANGATIVRNKGVFSKTGGNLLMYNDMAFENTGNFTQTAGNTDIGHASPLVTSTNDFNNFNTYDHNGGTTNIHDGGTLQNDSLYTHNDGTLTVHAGGVFNNDIINTINGGTVQINAGGTLSGTGFAFTGLNGGTLRVNGEMIQTGVTITGGTLEGTGTVANLGGTVGPGNSPGTLTVDGNYTQGSGGTLAMEIDSLLSFDVLDINGIAALDGILDLTVDAGYAASAQDGDMFTIVEWDSFSGAFDTVNGLNFATGKFFTLDYGDSGLTLTVNAQTVVGVPEPGMIALFGLGVAGIGFARRRRQRS
jgi:hypothetical protein